MAPVSPQGIAVKIYQYFQLLKNRLDKQDRLIHQYFMPSLSKNGSRPRPTRKRASTELSNGDEYADKRWWRYIKTLRRSHQS